LKRWTESRRCSADSADNPQPLRPKGGRISDGTRVPDSSRSQSSGRSSSICRKWRVKSELLTRQWAHVDFRNGWLRLEPGETKNDEGRMFPLTPMLRAVLERQRERTEAFQRSTGEIYPAVFHREGRPIKSFRRAWLTACRRAGLTGRMPHDFRRTAVRNLERAGVPRSTAMKMVGHKTETIYRRYAIADEGMLRAGGVKLEALHQADQPAERTVIPISEAPKRA